MIKNDNPYLIEFNVRMGDPECQTILPLLQSDLCEIFFNCCTRKLSEKTIRLNNEKSICIVVCSKGYPENYKKNSEISQLNNLSLKNNEYIFHAGTKLKDNKILNSGGRVLNFVAVSNNLKKSREDLIKQITKLDWEDGFFRKDIAYKVIDI